jgi:hypothetical protein
MLRPLLRLAAPLVAVAFFGMVSAARADSLPNPGLLLLPSLGSIPAGTLAGTASGNYTLLDVGNVVKGTGSYNVSVYSPDTGTGDTTITFQVHVNTGLLEEISLTDFGTFSTDVTQDGSGVNAAIVTRADGTVGFHFVPGLNSLTPDTATFIIRTNAPSYTNGSIQFIDGGIDTKASFGVAVPLPATASMGLVLLGGVGGIGAFRRMKSRRDVIA